MAVCQTVALWQTAPQAIFFYPRLAWPEVMVHGVRSPNTTYLPKPPPIHNLTAQRGLVGLWDGMVAGYSVVTLISGGAVLLSNWRRLAQEAMERSEVLPSNAKGDVVV